MKSFSGRHRRVMAGYLTVIMVMSLTFSAIIFNVTSSQLNSLPPPRHREAIERMDGGPSIKDWIEERNRSIRSATLMSLAIINLAVLSGGAVASYLLARWTLRPIEEALELQRQFIGDASHELKTPLAAMRITNEVALRKKKMTSALARQVVSKNITEVERMERLTESLLALSKAEDGGVDKEEFELTSVIKDVVESYQEIAKAKKISVKVDASTVMVEADRLAFSQVVSILLDNAIKYSAKNSVVNIRVKIQKHKIVLDMEDQGCGVAIEDRPYIFDRFYRADKSRTRTDVSGYGLGLAIAKSLSDANGISLQLKESSVGAGSTFRVVIPR